LGRMSLFLELMVCEVRLAPTRKTQKQKAFDKSMSEAQADSRFAHRHRWLVDVACY
jgi:hypothetical protein